MVAAWHLWEKTSDERWRALFTENIEQLWQTWHPVPDQGIYVWTQDLYGRIVQLVGAGHGFVGNVYPLLRGAALFDTTRREASYERCAKTLRMTGMFENGEANWPPSLSAPRPGGTNKMMQWCHGAPGVITALAADYPHKHSSDMDDMLLAGGEAVWTAGPLSKGHGLCHGTAGNGYAFLKLFKRTGNSLWLDRAPAFACTQLHSEMPCSNNTEWVATTCGTVTWDLPCTCGIALQKRMACRRLTSLTERCSGGWHPETAKRLQQLRRAEKDPP